MRKLFDEDVALSDVKGYIRNMRKKQNSKKMYFILGGVVAVLAICGITLAVLKYRRCYPFSEDMEDFEEFDTDGSGVYATESDFE